MTADELSTPPEGVVDRRITRPDGRVVAFTTWGADDDRPLLRIPGTPGSRFSLRADKSPWSERGLRVITTERPGFGASTRLPGRGFNEHADDLVAVLDHLGVQRVSVIGGSGAAPHILALCARHPDRVLAATVLAGATPVVDDAIDQMIDVNARFVRLALAGDHDGLSALESEFRDAMLNDPLAGLEDAAPADREIIDDPAWQAADAVAMREALRQGVGGMVDEDLALVNRWDDIDLSAVQCSLTWWHGTADRNVPLSAARRLLRDLRQARLVVWDEGGHFTGYRKEAEILDELLTRSGNR